MKSLAIHSHKGGVGKSTLTVNIGVELAKSSNVAIVDNDLAGPTLQTYFKKKAKQYFNQYLNQTAKIEECINEYNDEALKGKLYYFLSDPSVNTLDAMLQINQKTATTMLRQLVNLKKILRKQYEIDYIIIDTSPGVNIIAANAFVASDTILFVNKLSNADIEGSANMIMGILDYLENKAYMVANQIPTQNVNDEDARSKLVQLIENHLEAKIGKGIIQCIGILPMDFNLQLKEFETAKKTMRGESAISDIRSERQLYALDDPENEFMTLLKPVIDTIFG